MVGPYGGLEDPSHTHLWAPMTLVWPRDHPEVEPLSYKAWTVGTSLAIQSHFSSNAADAGLIPDQGTKVPHAACVLVTQSCLTLCGPMDPSLPGSSVHGLLQARILEYGAISFSRDLLKPGIEPGSPALQVDSLLSGPSRKPTCCVARPKQKQKKPRSSEVGEKSALMK